MKTDKARISVYYDGACLGCIRDRQNYERLSGKTRDDVQWIDITGKETLLRAIGIDPKKALMELHVKNENDDILREIDAYILLMQRVPILKPVSIIIGLPLIRPIIAKFYHLQVNRRLRKSGRM
jgi:predicted DCC family thiol-disulfide oxidoreductase YuxK